MNDIKLVIKNLIKEHGTQAILEGVSESLKDGEKEIRETHDQRVGTAFDYILCDLVRVLPSLSKASRKLSVRTLLSKPVREALLIRGADQAYQSQAMREAYIMILEEDSAPTEDSK